MPNLKDTLTSKEEQTIIRVYTRELLLGRVIIPEKALICPGTGAELPRTCTVDDLFGSYTMPDALAQRSFCQQIRVLTLR